VALLVVLVVLVAVFPLLFRFDEGTGGNSFFGVFNLRLPPTGESVI